MDVIEMLWTLLKIASNAATAVVCALLALGVLEIRRPDKKARR